MELCMRLFGLDFCVYTRVSGANNMKHFKLILVTILYLTFTT